MTRLGSVFNAGNHDTNDVLGSGERGVGELLRANLRSEILVQQREHPLHRILRAREPLPRDLAQLTPHEPIHR
ncbi:hypothetical protein AKJ09_00481 [Labilithrix luteola]|uniref:Uncharacterized protein n=1 Tax=Labilithrix luteola TaxID=1391654 RepID=A0A0K1PJX8_9BACT|nr:hypothetical protein [Labilithrix luteola]AKU93817.1 hypothetical protein AKJ09_00481 [Labilithrix luteola]